MKLTIFTSFATATVVLRPRAASAEDMVNTPTYTPTPTWAIDPTPKPTSPCTGNTPDWVDSYGDGCDWYENSDVPGCPHFGDSYEGTMGVANDNCCFCAGSGAPIVAPQPTPFPTYKPTMSRAPTTPYPTYRPTVSRAPTTPTTKPTSPCTGNTPEWVDSYGDGCDWYENNDVPGCDNHGSEYDGGMGVAKDNCCYCTMD